MNLYETFKHNTVPDKLYLKFLFCIRKIGEVDVVMPI